MDFPEVSDLVDTLAIDNVNSAAIILNQYFYRIYLITSNVILIMMYITLYFPRVCEFRTDSVKLTLFVVCH